MFFVGEFGYLGHCRFGDPGIGTWHGGGMERMEWGWSVDTSSHGHCTYEEGVCWSFHTFTGMHVCQLVEMLVGRSYIIGCLVFGAVSSEIRLIDSTIYYDLMDDRIVDGLRFEQLINPSTMGYGGNGKYYAMRE